MSQRASISCTRGPTMVPTRPSGSRIISGCLSGDGDACDGEVHAVDENVLEVRVGGERHVVDRGRDRLGAAALALRYQGELGAEGSGVADVANPLLGDVRGDEADA